MSPRRHATSGMTLVEVLVALAVFAVIGIAAFSMLDQTLRSNALPMPGWWCWRMNSA